MIKKERIDYRYNVKEYLSLLSRHKWILLLLVLFVLITEAILVLNRYLFKVIIDNGTEFAANEIAKTIFLKILFVVAIVYLLGVFLSFLLNYFKMYFLNRLDVENIYDLKKKYFSHIINLDYSFHTTHKTGSLISRLSRGSGAIERMNDSILFNFAPLILQLLLALTALAFLDAMSGIIILLVMTTFVLFSYHRQRKSEESNILYNKAEDIEKGNTADFLTNIDSIRYYGKEKNIIKRYTKLTDNTKKSALTNWDYWNFTSAGQNLILGIGTFLILFFSLSSFLKGNITLGTLTFIYTTYIGLISPMFGFVHGLRGISRSMADFQDLFEYNKIKKEITDRKNAKNLKVKEGEIKFKDIKFNYGKREIFRNFNLTIEPKKKYALVGHSGCGKTTLIRLLYRLYDVESGAILIDGEDIRNLKQNSLRGGMSVVPQEAILFDDTIYNNILFANQKAKREEVLKAIKFAQLDKIIDSFPQKENTIVGERGVRLSGGEKQRVSIARAILANKKILILDEATSSLDSQTEHEIQKALQNLMKGRTSLIIAHRLSTIMNSDEIIVMKKGKIVQTGKHNQLINKEGEYQRLWNLQKGGYIK